MNTLTENEEMPILEWAAQADAIETEFQSRLRRAKQDPEAKSAIRQATYYKRTAYGFMGSSEGYADASYPTSDYALCQREALSYLKMARDELARWAR